MIEDKMEEQIDEGPLLTADEEQIIEKKIWMHNEHMFTREWWKEKFKHAKSIGYGGKVLRDEDKLWFASTTNYRWLRRVVEAVVEKFGDEAKGVIFDTIQEDGKEMGEFFLDVLGIEERDPLAFIAVMASVDSCWGHNNAITNVAPDRSRATSVCSWCELAASGSTTKALCELVGGAMVMGMHSAVDPTGTKIAFDGYVGPPCVVVARAAESLE